MISVQNLSSSLKRKLDESDQTPRERKKVHLAIKEPEKSIGSSALTLPVYRNWVRNALDELDKGNDGPLSNLTSQLQIPASSNEALSTEQLRLLLTALTSEISRLDSIGCAPIISSILRLHWSSSEDTAFINAYIKFIAVLISGIPKWWTEVANKIASELELAQVEPHHSLLKHILRIIPTSPGILLKIFSKNFPHKSASTTCYLNYIRNLLDISEYSNELQPGIWEIIIERIVQLDVELYDEEEDDDEDEIDEEKVEEVDEEDEEVEKKSINFNEEEEETYEIDTETRNLASTRRKLDETLCLLFRFLDTKINTETLETGDGVSLFMTLLDLFKKYILPTHRTRSVQYIIFRSCSVRSDLLDAFLVSMLEIALFPSENIELREKALQYTSSFIARCKSLTKTQIVFVISILTGWIGRYIKEREMEVDHALGGMGRFKMFYSACQSLFYIFCFRHRLLKKEIGEFNDQSSEWECDLDKLFQRMIVTKFNPLKYCKSTVVGMFAGIAQKENAAYCFTVMEQNRIGGLRSVSPLSPSTERGPNQGFAIKREFSGIDAYFPFDPLSLKQSRHLLGDIFIEWDEVAEPSDSSSDEEEEEEEEEEDDEDEEDEEDILENDK